MNGFGLLQESPTPDVSRYGECMFFRTNQSPRSDLPVVYLVPYVDVIFIYYMYTSHSTIVNDLEVSATHSSA